MASSYVGFQKVIPHLTDPENSETNFELVIPSLPGFGFSERSHRPGLGPVEAAQILLKLMKRLGRNQFYVQGGGWGSLIATNMACLYPENVVALHINLCMSQHSRTFLRILFNAIYPLIMATDDSLCLYPLSNEFARVMEKTGYSLIQATKPDTIGAALSNSPSGLAAYILEKLSGETNVVWREREVGGLLPYYDIDDLLDNVMIYWVSYSVTSSMRFYSEVISRQTTAYRMDNVPVKIPAGCFYLSDEPLSSQTEFFLQDKYHQLISFTISSKGRHFATFEAPEAFTNDVINYFNLVDTITTSKFTKKPKPLK